MKISWNGFSKKSYHERLELLKAQALLSPEKQTSLEQDEQVSLAVADQLSENVVGTFSLPYSISAPTKCACSDSSIIPLPFRKRNTPAIRPVFPGQWTGSDTAVPPPDKASG